MHAIFRKQFKKSYKDLQAGEKDKCDKRLELFEEDPFHPVLNNHKLYGEYNGCRSINITGDLRAIYKPLKDGDVAYFIELDTHSNLYD